MRASSQQKRECIQKGWEPLESGLELRVGFERKINVLVKLNR